MTSLRDVFRSGERRSILGVFSLRNRMDHTKNVVVGFLVVVSVMVTEEGTMTSVPEIVLSLLGLVRDSVLETVAGISAILVRMSCHFGLLFINFLLRFERF